MSEQKNKTTNGVGEEAIDEATEAPLSSMVTATESTKKKNRNTT